MITISFTQEYLNLIDELLSSCYNKVTPRSLYLLFLQNLEHKMAYIRSEEDPYINNNLERLKYGRASLPGRKKGYD